MEGDGEVIQFQHGREIHHGTVRREFQVRSPIKRQWVRDKSFRSQTCADDISNEMSAPPSLPLSPPPLISGIFRRPH